VSGLILTGERTVPGLDRENYWFRRHEAAYAWVVGRGDLGGSTVVDAGSGEGYGAAMLARAGTRQVIALEYDELAAGHSNRRYGEVRTVRANLDALPVTDAAVDVVITMQVIEHLWDLPRFLRECRRVLRPGGTIIAATPNRLTFSPGLERHQRPTNPFHVEEFDAAQVEHMLQRAGFAQVEVVGLHHGDRIPEGLVERQVRAALADDWPTSLVHQVSAVTVDDFQIRASGLETSLDLIGVGRVPDGS
jgi:SAM-dependent methyltransferase